MNLNTPPSVELFIATGCAYCPIVLTELSENLKQGNLSSLKITNIAVENKRAEELNIRSVPWFSISNNQSFMIFSGNYTPKEIQQWLATSQNEKGMQEYIEDALATGDIMKINQTIQLKPSILANIISLLSNEDTSMDIRIGLDALLEQFSGTKILQNYSTELKNIAASNIPRLQIDALHYVALLGVAENKSFLQDKINDKNPQIKEAAIEALETLNDLLE